MRKRILISFIVWLTLFPIRQVLADTIEMAQDAYRKELATNVPNAYIRYLKRIYFINGDRAIFQYLYAIMEGRAEVIIEKGYQRQISKSQMINQLFNNGANTYFQALNQLGFTSIVFDNAWDTRVSDMRTTIINKVKAVIDIDSANVATTQDIIEICKIVKPEFFKFLKQIHQEQSLPTDV